MDNIIAISVAIGLMKKTFELYSATYISINIFYKIIIFNNKTRFIYNYVVNVRDYSIILCYLRYYSIFLIEIDIKDY